MHYLEIHTVDVGQGDCQFIAIKNAANHQIVRLILIDVGNASTIDVVFNYWASNFSGKQVDFLFISHWDADHFGGGAKDYFPQSLIKLALKRLFVAQCPLFSPLESRPPVDTKNPNAFVFWNINVGNLFYFDNNIYIDCYAIDRVVMPFNGQITIGTTPTNKSSIALLIRDTAANFIYYTGGDLSHVEEKKMANDKSKFNYINSFKLSHHGSETSTRKPFLDSIKKYVVTGGKVCVETFAICSSGFRSQHGHPNFETLKRLKTAEIKTILTNQKEGYEHIEGFAFAGFGYGYGFGNIRQCTLGQRLVFGGWFYADQIKNILPVPQGLTDGFMFFSSREIISVVPIYFGTASVGSPIDNFLAYLPKKTKYNKLSDDECQIPELFVLVPKDTVLRDALLINKSNKLILEGSFNNIKLNGVVSADGVADLMNTDSSVEIEILKLIEVINPDVLNLIPSFIIELLGKLSIQEFKITHDFKQRTQTTISVGTSIAKEISITEKIKFNDPRIVFQSIYAKAGSLMLLFKASIMSEMYIRKKLFNIKIDFSSNAIWELEIVPKELSLLDIASIIPGFDPETLKSWASTLGLENIEINKASVGVNFGSQNDKLDSLSLGLNIKIFSEYILSLTLTYRSGLGMTVYGGILKSINVYDFLDKLGLEKEYYGFLPDVKIEKLGFSAVPSNKTYSIIAEIDAEFSYDLGELKCAIESFTFEIEKSREGTFVKASLYGSVTKSNLTGNSQDGDEEVNILVTGSYKTGKGFVFSGEIWNLDSNKFLKLFGIELPKEIVAPKFEHIKVSNKPFTVSSTLDTGFTVEVLDKYLSFRISQFEYIKGREWSISGSIDFFGLLTSFRRDSKEIRISISKFSFSDLIQIFTENSDITKHFDFDLEKMEIIIADGSFSFMVGITNIAIGEAIKIERNKLEFSIRNKEISFGIETGNLQIITNNRTFSTKGGLKVSTRKLSFYGQSNDSFKDVFGIKDFNFGQLFISINQQLQPPAFAIGFMGNLMFKKVSGSIALYISPNMPSEQLLAVTFSGLTLYDITEGIVGELNPGLEDIFKSIGIIPIEILPAVLPEPEEGEGVTEEVYQSILNIDPDTAKSELVLKSYKDYSWIQDGTYLVENEDKFRQYQIFSSNNDQRYALSKYVTFYGCLSPLGVEMNGRHFDTGFAFSGNIKFLGVEQLVNFHANPKGGLFLYYEMKQSIKIGNVLSLSRVDDNSKGPILSLSTYEHNRHFVLIAKLDLFDGLMQFGARIIFANSQFSFMLYSEVFGFKSAIMVNSNWESLEKASFEIYYQFVTSGFGDITQYIANKLYEKAEGINRAIKEARGKLEDARRTVLEYQRNIDNVSHSIKDKIRELEDLKRVDYPWYESYRFVELGIRIMAVGVEIGVLGSYKAAQILLLEAALAVLKIADDLLAKTGKLSKEVIEGVADVIATIGKGIDWLILIHKLEASLAISDKKRLFNFDFEFRLAGIERKVDFKLEHEGKLSDMLKQQIENFFNDKKLMYGDNSSLEMEDDITGNLDDIYGQISEEEMREIRIANYDELENEFKKASDRNQNYRDIIKHEDLLSSVKYIFQEFDVNEDKDEGDQTSKYTNQMDQRSINSISNDLGKVLKNLKNEEFFDNEVKDQSTKAIDKLNKLLKKEEDGNRIMSNEESLSFKSMFKESKLKIRRVKQEKLISKRERSKELKKITALMDFMESTAPRAKEKATTETTTNVFMDSIQEEDRPSIQVIREIIEKYNKIINSEKVHDYMKISCYVNVGIGYSQLGDRSNSINNMKAGLDLAAFVLSKESYEYLKIKEQIKNTWNIDLE
ncbi:hypothetical protein E6C50_01940 [Flavobacterium supellecticarium]|uniref:Metallo-beta-lactamase domain-containing protein n=1 Tax=Flavobacterium supellecticarium TaxID=2565924 RepID=A0A4S4A3K2_9FLAO|nr:hypothetical protein [Flavobacterium supellecticarium]THF52992.1 hypothetical protein E6C50_01940 [Flavobacterium supellecticarium]